MKMNKKYVSLYSSGASLLIVKKKTGIIYKNQAGGNFCLQPEEEGYLVPLDSFIDDIEDRIARHFGFASNRITEEEADTLDSIFKQFRKKFGTKYLWGLFSVDREQLNNSFEAWINVKIDNISDENIIIKNLNKIDNRGIITWTNSD